MVNLQRQMCQQLEAVQVSLSTPNITESIVVKPTLFHGRVGFSVSPYTLPTKKYRLQVTRQLLNMKNWMKNITV